MQSNSTKRGNFGTDLSNTINNIQSEKNSKAPSFANKILNNQSCEDVENNFFIPVKASNDVSIGEPAMDVDADDEIGSTKSVSSTSTVQEEFQKVTDTLLEQVEESYTNVKRSHNITVSLLQELNAFQQTVSQYETKNVKENQKKIHDLVNCYIEKVNTINERNSETVNVISNIEETFHYIQSLQSQCYQNNIISLQSKLDSKEEEINDLKQNYLQLELWVLTLFREVINYSKISNNAFKLTIKDIQKSIRCPPKRSNLESIYRYLIQYLYAEEESDVTEKQAHSC